VARSALRLELVTALLRSLPKEQRRRLVPLPDTAAAVLGRLRPRREPLADALSREVGVAAADFDLTRLPAHLRMTFRVEGESGEVLAEGEDLEAVRAAVAPRLRAELSAATASVERSGMRDWEIGELPQVVELPDRRPRAGLPGARRRGRVRRRAAAGDAGRPGRRDVGGTRRLLLLTVPARPVPSSAGSTTRRSSRSSPRRTAGSPASWPTRPRRRWTPSAPGGGPAWDAAGFARLRDHVAGGLADTTATAVEQVVRVLAAFRDVQRRLDELALAAPLREARLDVAGQIGGLVYDGFIADTGVDRLADVERYLRGAAMRLDRLPAQVAVDADRMCVVHELEAQWRATPGAPAEVRWQLQSCG
jgi:ATP-dependent helicase HrpA